jgi:hypothetical protein
LPIVAQISKCVNRRLMLAMPFQPVPLHPDPRMLFLLVDASNTGTIDHEPPTGFTRMHSFAAQYSWQFSTPRWRLQTPFIDPRNLLTIKRVVLAAEIPPCRSHSLSCLSVFCIHCPQVYSILEPCAFRISPKSYRTMLSEPPPASRQPPN